MPTQSHPEETRNTMKIARLIYEGQAWAGVVESEHIRLIGRCGEDIPESAAGFIRFFVQEFELISHGTVPVSEAHLIAPLLHPQKVICVGRNYAKHAAEMGSEVKDLPVIFNKFSDSITGPGASIKLPEVSESVDFEAELVVVMGRAGKDIPPENARQHIFGFCCGNDVTARDWQKGRPGGQWLLGKSCDDFAPIGPWITTRDEIEAENLEIRLHLNGVEMQHANTSQLIVKIDYLIAHLSRFCTWQPGDLLFTGTPAGVGAGRNPPVFLQPGDETVVSIDGLGELRNTFA